MAEPIIKHEHNRSAQVNVAENDDLALHVSKEHHHEHLHHEAYAEKDRHDDAAYTKGTTAERTTGLFGPSDSQDYSSHRMGHPQRELPGDRVEDAEKGVFSPEIKMTSSRPEGDRDSEGHTMKRFYARYKLFVHLFTFCLFTGWWIASLILHRGDMNWEIPFLLWLAITLRLVFFHVPITIITKPMHWIWNNTGVRGGELIPEHLRIPLGALLVIAVILVAAFVTPEVEDNTRSNRAVSLFGLAVFLFLMWITSKDRRKINWHTVIVGMLVQFIIALFVLRTGVGFNIFNFISKLARELLGFADDGVAFLTSTSVSKLSWFLITVLPAILFFVSIVSVLYYWGTLQWFVKKAAVFFFWSMRVSGAEAVVAAASPFIGQGESAMLIKPFVNHLTIAELHQVMTSGFATISGSVLIAYIGLGVNGSALVSSCVMSIPASLALSKMRWPETEETLTAGRVVIPDDDEHRASNTLHAFANGAWLGLKIAGMILATLLCIIGVVSLINGLLGWWGSYININNPPLTLQLILGYVCYPLAFLLGVPRNGDLFKVGQLIGTKLIENEFVAYSALQTEPDYANLSSRSRLIVTYALCGFANIGSLGTQIGVLSQIAPGRTGDVSRIAFSALITGALSTFTSASIAGMLVTNQAAFYSPQSATAGR
ncbi:MAG: hypothetical protein M1828_002915 [Chrysothrix sp. TS-e1954]|nr:MAG: hypothetical protein M1828_002915 [Chrysothrix sp. TS-e1954]